MNLSENILRSDAAIQKKKYGEFIGYYDIQFDKVNGAFYIDLANKKTY